MSVLVLWSEKIIKLTLTASFAFALQSRRLCYQVYNPDAHSSVQSNLQCPGFKQPRLADLRRHDFKDPFPSLAYSTPLPPLTPSLAYSTPLPPFTPRSSPRQASPAADDASPAAVGKLFSEQMWTLQSSHPPSPSPPACRRARTRTATHITLYYHSRTVTHASCTVLC